MGFRHAFSPGALLTIHCQVKHGSSYKSPQSTGKVLKILVDSATTTALRQGSGPSLLVWVPPLPSSRGYWYILDGKRSPGTVLPIPRGNHITPALRYYLTRAASHMNPSQRHARTTVRMLDQSLIHKEAKAAFREVRRRKWKHPLFGELTVSLHAFRHVTRRSKATRQRTQALRVAPYLKHFLECNPSRMLFSEASFSNLGGRITEKRHVILWYKNALMIGGRPHCLLLRVEEAISYPKDWHSMPLGVSDVRQEARLESWWSKEEK